MATKEEKQELIEILKFTPRTYKINMWGYGGEKVMGTVEEEVWNYCMDNQVDLQDIAWNSEAAEDMGLDEDKLPFPPGSWYECDDMTHVHGVNRDAGTLQIEDENGNTVLESPIDNFSGDNIDDESPELNCLDEAWIGSRKKGEIVFIGSSNEKGTFFEGEIELKAPFDIRKLTLQYDEVDGEEIIHSVMYDGEDIDNWGGSTDGKSSDFVMVRVIDDEGNFERYEPEEKDWGHPEIGPSPDDWEKSPEFKFEKVKPTHIGWYRAVWSHFGTSYGSLYWNGESFGAWYLGKFIPQSNIDRWQGYNWDTSNWANRPPEPPGITCSNKDCGWVGLSEERKTDDNYDDHCPKCDGTEFNWIDYDPDTKEGRANRKKYCITQEEEKQFIAGLDTALAELAEESGIN